MKFYRLRGDKSFDEDNCRGEAFLFYSIHIGVF